MRQGFTGYEEDGETGLDYAQARYLSPAQGRFASPDPLLASGRTTRPQSWNRYTYVLNNPLKFVDPNGLETVYLNNGFGPGGDIKGGKPISIDAHGWTDERKPRTITIGDIKITIPDFSNFKPNFYPVLSGDKGGNPTQHPDQKLVVVESEDSAELTITTRPASPSSVNFGAGKDANGTPILLTINNFHFQFILTRRDGTNISDFTYTVSGTPYNAATDLDGAGNSPPVLSVLLFQGRSNAIQLLMWAEDKRRFSFQLPPDLAQLK